MEKSNDEKWVEGINTVSRELQKEFTTKSSLEETVRAYLLANFMDGDSWEEADAAMFTKHGALDIALFFYRMAISDALGALPLEDQYMNLAWNHGVAECRRRIRAISSIITTKL